MGIVVELVQRSVSTDKTDWGRQNRTICGELLVYIAISTIDNFPEYMRDEFYRLIMV